MQINRVQNQPAQRQQPNRPAATPTGAPSGDRTTLTNEAQSRPRGGRNNLSPGLEAALDAGEGVWQRICQQMGMQCSAQGG
ncbi:MAG: hypothetical protein AB7S38_10305 [Vulcanimicrobiota bacterium]